MRNNYRRRNERSTSPFYDLRPLVPLLLTSFMLTGCRPSPPPTSVPTPNRTATVEPTLSGAAEPAVDNIWHSMFDGKTLDGWSITNFGGEGEVYVEDGHIVMDFGAYMTGITYQGDLPTLDYEVRWEAQRDEGNDFFCGFTFPVNDAHCSLIAGGWGGGVVGISSINGMDASENETTTYMTFENDQWYRFHVKVSEAKIEAWIDDEQLVDVELADREWSTRPEVERSKPCGFATWDTRGAVRNIEFRKLVGGEG